METYGMTFGKRQIARNFNTYQMARATEEFWTAWRNDKEGMKQAGYSVFKTFGEFFVAYYDGGKATEEEYRKQCADELQFVKNNIVCNLEGMEGRACEKDIEDAVAIVESSDDYGFFGLENIVNNKDYYINEAREAYFQTLL